MHFLSDSVKTPDCYPRDVSYSTPVPSMDQQRRLGRTVDRVAHYHLGRNGVHSVYDDWRGGRPKVTVYVATPREAPRVRALLPPVVDGYPTLVAIRQPAEAFSGLGTFESDLEAQTGIPARVISAIGKIESNGRWNAVRFEPHLFWRTKLGLPTSSTGQQIRDAMSSAQMAQVPYTPGATRAASSVGSETNAAALDRAAAVDPAVAVRSASFGAFQDLGASLLRVAGPDPTAALAAFRANPERISGLLFADWVAHAPAGFAAAAHALNFDQIAHYYNGCGDCTLYAGRLRDAYNSAWTLASSAVSTAEEHPISTALVGLTLVGGAGLFAYWAYRRRKRAIASNRRRAFRDAA